MEHVLYGELKDFTDEEKEIRSDDFADLYEGRAEAFIEFISDLAVAVPGTYKDTWNYIEKNYNSLNRHSNMHLLFEQNVLPASSPRPHRKPSDMAVSRELLEVCNCHHIAASKGSNELCLAVI